MKRKAYLLAGLIVLALAVVLICLLAGGGDQAAPAPSQAVLSEVTPAPAPVQAPESAPTAPPESEAASDPKGNSESVDPGNALAEDGSYDSKEDVALYLHLYGELPDNYITKNEAEDLGWHGGSVERYAPGKCIGGDRFTNREGSLPKANGRTWTECDIDTLGASNRGAKRIVYSNDGLIYYTDDHYESFELLYDDR